MIKKIQSYLNIVLILFAIVGIIYFVINVIIGMFKEEKIITKENLDEYITQDKLVTSYGLFNALEECTSNLLSTYMKEEYSEIYKIVGEKTKKAYSKDEIITILTKYAKDILNVQDIMSGNRIWLDKAYRIDDRYIAEIKSNYSEEALYLIFNLDTHSLTYTIDLIV